ncbi:MAG: hypothetical protein H7336_10555 [Bacteriovorax sp.]|nr:hypothetical protein [Bacteriovorax sp.]
MITPYTYSFLNSFDKKYETEHAEEVKHAESAKILILGDRMGKTLDTYKKNLQEQFGAALKAPPSIYNWSVENEGLFRTIHKLKMLKKLPPIIIYFGASSELLEKKFRVEDKKKIMKNSATYDDERLISLIITFPWLSKVLYKNVQYFDLAGFTEYKNFLAAPQKLEEKELSFKFFEYEMKEMIEYIKDKKSNLVMITTPINLEVEPKEVCAHASSDNVIGAQQEIEAEIKEGAFKTAFLKARELSNITFSNARSFYLYGRAALGVGDLKTAREALLKASVFDCANWRGNAIYNAIMKAQAKKSMVQLVDFDQFMTSNLSQEGLYFDEIVPQNIFYQSMIKELGDILKKILSIE